MFTFFSSVLVFTFFSSVLVFTFFSSVLVFMYGGWADERAAIINVLVEIINTLKW